MKALTLHQPWASLVAIGEKRIETRSWQTKYRGPIAIHASASPKSFDLLPGDCEGKREGDWRYGYIGEWQATYCFRSGDEGQRGDAELVHLSDGREFTLPLGAVVATAILIDCAPIGGSMSFRTGIFEGDEGDYAGHHVLVVSDFSGDLVLDEPAGRAVDVSSELPLGDYSVGRWGWLLADIRPLPEPIPAKGSLGLWEWIGGDFLRGWPVREEIQAMKLLP